MPNVEKLQEEAVKMTPEERAAAKEKLKQQKMAEKMAHKEEVRRILEDQKMKRKEELAKVKQVHAKNSI